MKKIENAYWLVVAIGLVAGFWLTNSKGAWAQENKPIQIQLELPESCRQVSIEFFSDRNLNVSKLTDVASKNKKGINPGMEVGKDMWFPVIDIQLKDGLKAVAVLTDVNEHDHYSWNSNFWSNYFPLQDTLIFDEQLEHWENHLYVESKTAQLKQFFLKKTFSINPGCEQLNFEFHPLANSWKGRVRIYNESNEKKELIEEREINEQQTLVDVNTSAQLNRENVIEQLKQTIHYILKTQNKNPMSPTYGGLFLFYDLDSEMYRRSDWMWTYGPAIKLLLDAAKIPELAKEFGYENLIETARLIGEASLRFQILDETHPAYGITICRYDPRMIYSQGFSGYVSPADAHFLAGWGWIPLYEATGDKRFLDAAILQSEEIGRVMKGDSIVEQDFVLKAEKWKNWTMDESGFGMIGFSKVYKHTQDEKHKQIGKEYMDGLINILEDPNGLWYRTWHRNRADHTDDCWPLGRPVGTPVLIKDGQTARGNGWAMIGLLAAHQMLPENDYYLQKAITLAENILNKQLDDGSFPWQLYEPEQTDISEKGTPLWSLLFYQLYEYTNNPRHLEAAEKALQWCIRNQYTGGDELAKAGIVGDTWSSGIVYRNYFPLICTYTMDWMGLALLEQLKLTEKN